MTMVMQQVVSKSQFKAGLLAYLRSVEKNKQPLIITHDGAAVIKVVPYKKQPVIKSLRRTVLSYKKPTEPIGLKDWEVLK